MNYHKHASGNTIWVDLIEIGIAFAVAALLMWAMVS